MTKLHLIAQEEWNPLTLYAGGEGDTSATAEFTDEELADLVRVQREFQEWQRKIAERFKYEYPFHPNDFVLYEQS